MNRLLILLPLLFLSVLVQAQPIVGNFTVHPPNVTRDAPFLILVEDAWADGCGGRVEASVDATTIEIVATLASPILGRVCTSVVTPFKQLINPRSVAGAGIEFADAVTINYLVNNGNGAELRSTGQINFSVAPNLPALIQTGGWTTSKLESSGLFIDQQDGILSAALFDYGADNEASWYYAAGAVNGNVYVGAMQRFGLINCVTQPCPRAAPIAGGTINVLLKDANEILVGYEGIEFPSGLFDGNAEAMLYKRLDFARSPSLPVDPGPGNELLPDLVGDWVGGIGGEGARVDDFRALTIVYSGLDDSTGVSSHVFEAYRSAEFNAGNAVPEFLLVCGDLGPVLSGVHCRLEGYVYGGQVCISEFGYAAVGERRLATAAVCGLDVDPVQTRFELYRR